MSPTAIEATNTKSVIYIVRHAESMGNITRKMLTPEEAVLTDHGRLQAKMLGKLLTNEKFTVAISSDFPRALETAQIILAESVFSADIPLQTTEKIREKFFGIYEKSSISYTEVTKAMKESGQEFVDWVPEGGESRADMEGRIESFFQDIFAIIDKSDVPQTILATTHADVLTHLFKFIPSTPEKFTVKNWNPEYFKMTPNTGFIKIAIEKTPQPIEPRELEVLSCNQNPHLKSLGEDTLQAYYQETESVEDYQKCVHQ